MKFAPIFAIIIGFSISITVMAKVKSVGVRGTITCDGEPVNDGLIELFGERNGYFSFSFFGLKIFDL